MRKSFKVESVDKFPVVGLLFLKNDSIRMQLTEEGRVEVEVSG
jgi:hypothetical protein